MISSFNGAPTDNDSVGLKGRSCDMRCVLMCVWDDVLKKTWKQQRRKDIWGVTFQRACALHWWGLMRTDLLESEEEPVCSKEFESGVQLAMTRRH